MVVLSLHDLRTFLLMITRLNNCLIILAQVALKYETKAALANLEIENITDGSSIIVSSQSTQGLGNQHYIRQFPAICKINAG